MDQDVGDIGQQESSLAKRDSQNHGEKTGQEHAQGTKEIDAPMNGPDFHSRSILTARKAAQSLNSDGNEHEANSSKTTGQQCDQRAEGLVTGFIAHARQEGFWLLADELAFKWAGSG